MDNFIRDFLIPIEAAKFFFFDAEKIVSLAEANEIAQRKELSKAYSEVLGIKKYEDLRKSLRALQGKFSEESATPKDRQSLIRLKGEAEELEIENEERKLQIERRKESIIEYRHEVRLIQERLIKESNAISVDELESLRSRQKEVEELLDETRSKFRDLLELAPLAINGDYLLQIMEQVVKELQFRSFNFKKEEIDNKSEEIIDKIEENRPFPIETKIKDFYNSQIRELVKKYFFQDAVFSETTVITLHEFSENEKNTLSELLNYFKHSYKDLFKSLNRDFKSQKYELDNISRKLKNAESNTEDPILDEFRKRKSMFEAQILSAESEIENLNKEIGVDENKITNKKGEISELRKKVDIADKYIEKNKVAERLISELNDFIKHYKDEKKKSLENKILHSLTTLMHTLKVKRVEVNMIQEDIDIQLYNERDEIIAKEGLSKGQQQLYATSLLKALVDESNINFPVFIDSPMQKFDLEHAKNIIKYFYPNVSEQVVVFPLLGKELTEKEFGYLKNNISQCYLIHKKGETSSFLPVEDNKLFETYHNLYPHD
jgi:DNA sulfur modification protein DndD